MKVFCVVTGKYVGLWQHQGDGSRCRAELLTVADWLLLFTGGSHLHRELWPETCI